MASGMAKVYLLKNVDRQILFKILGLGAAAVCGIITSHLILRIIRQNQRKKKVWQTIHYDSVRAHSKKNHTRVRGQRRWTTDSFPNQKDEQQLEKVCAEKSLQRPSMSVVAVNGSIGSDVTTAAREDGFSQQLMSNSTHSVQPVASSVMASFDDDNDEALGLCNRGLEYLEEALHHWEEALTCISQPPPQSSIFAITTSDESRFVHKLESVLEQAINLQEECDQLLLMHRKPLVLPWKHVTDVDTPNTVRDLTKSQSDMYLTARSSDSDAGSFQSALEDFDDDVAVTPSCTGLSVPLSMAQCNHPLYHCGVLEAQHVGVACRTLRTQLLRCHSDVDFLAKLHALRMAMEVTFEDLNNIRWFQQLGRDMLAELLIQAERDPKDFLQAFDDLVSYVEVPDNWTTIQEELQSREVVYFSFYDIVLDFIVMDAFDDLDSPPSPVTHILNNRWLSNGFKEASLNTAIWTVYRGKRHNLKYSHGFISHFYTVAEQVSAVLAWGFLGPPTHIKRLCTAFKKETVSFLVDLFDVQKLGYVSIEETAANVMILAREHGKKLMDDMAELSIQYDELPLVEP